MPAKGDRSPPAVLPILSRKAPQAGSGPIRHPHPRVKPDLIAGLPQPNIQLAVLIVDEAFVATANLFERRAAEDAQVCRFNLEALLPMPVLCPARPEAATHGRGNGALG